MSKVGIKDIAARAGVSIATVSHALRKPGRVSEATRKKVLAAADEIGYMRNNLAASLRTSRSGNIVVIIPDVADNHVYGIIKAIEKVAHRRGYSVLLGDTQGSAEREREFAAMTRSRQADGIILMSHRLPFDVTKNDLSPDKLPPLVNVCEFTGYDIFPTVAIDDLQAGIDATRHLVELGHSEIAVITGDMETTSSQKRLQGFKTAMADAGLQYNERLIVRGKYSARCGETATGTLLMQKERPTAIFCFSDEIAMGCMYALRQHNFEIPNDISVIGVDNIPFARYLAPSLTTVGQPTADIGTTCATILLDLIDGKPPEMLHHVLQHELLVRQSTRRLQ
ncbi:MAG: LacI family DNA-binding transcriptional regulator [Woeseia sp.]